MAVKEVVGVQKLHDCHSVCSRCLGEVSNGAFQGPLFCDVCRVSVLLSGRLRHLILDLVFLVELGTEVLLKVLSTVGVLSHLRYA